MKIINKNFNGNKLKIIDNFLNDEDYQDLLNLDLLTVFYFLLDIIL